MGWFDFLKSTKEPEPVLVSSKPVKDPEPVAVVASMPVGSVMYRFRALKDFWSPKFESQYIANAIYSVRQGNEELAKSVVKWVSERKVRVI